MPMYTYLCSMCGTEQEQILPIERRDDAYCVKCKCPVSRQVDRPGMVWAPTKSGGNHA
jgi:putative FmdB family regulatory protein